MRTILALVGIHILAFGASGAGKQPVTGADVLKIVNVTSVVVASDGGFAVYGVQTIHTDPPSDPKGEPVYKYRTNLFRIDLKNPRAHSEQLTFGDRSDSSPVISPDNRALAFVRVENTPAPPSASAKPKPQVWLLPLAGPGEAHAITRLEYGALAPVWRPDGKALLVSSAIPISKIDGAPHFDLESPERDWFDWDRPKPGVKGDDAKVDARPDGDRRALRNWLARNASKDNPSVIDRINFLGEQDLQHELEIPELYVLDLERHNQATQITKDFYSHIGAQYSPDGRSIIYVSTPAGKEHPDRVKRSAIWIMAADGSNPHLLLDRKDYAFNSPRFAPDGASLIVTGIQTDEPAYRQSHLARFDLKAGRLTWLTEKWDSSARGGQVTADGNVLFASPWHGGEPLLRVPLAGGEATPITTGPTGVGPFDEGGGRIVYALISVPDPNELYLRDKDGSVRQLTTLNSAWLKDKELVTPEEHWITRPGGLKEQYWVMNPTHADAGKKYPWVVDMHGGPSAMWGPGEFSMWWEFQLFNAWGYGVVYANPRGSSGYGYAYQRANYQDWGKGPMEDVLAALEDAGTHTSQIDKDRLFLTGGSYAGYLTAWMIGHDQRFKAASAQRGVYDLSTFYGESNAYSLVESEFGGFPWQARARKLLDEESPITYVEQIHTPFLIIHGSQDFRTGFSQSEMLFRSLKQLKRPVEYIRYPGIGHELTRSGPPLQRMDHMLRIIEFFERYAHNDRPAPVEQKASNGGAETAEVHP